MYQVLPLAPQPATVTTATKGITMWISRDSMQRARPVSKGDSRMVLKALGGDLSHAAMQGISGQPQSQQNAARTV